MALLIVNPRAGVGKIPADVLAAARALGIMTHILRAGDDLRAVVDDAEAVGVAGGDGSLAPVAELALELDLPFACIPTGTRNHFARDAGLDRSDPVATLAALTEGSERRVDVGRANGRVFLNNAALGAYAHLVRRREQHRRRGDAFVRLRALAAVAVQRRRPGPVVANNRYELSVLSLGERARLDEGLLYLYAPTGLLRPAWQERSGTGFIVGSAGTRMRAALDGEADVLTAPIEFRIEPGALRLLVPRDPVG
jgi:diacylglycerol kinase family enzyme